ncbi:hypothetical protein RhiirA4_464785 [Rhizophagus irregularis]|uniref:Uncharacterized protein n=1 Tax=Rhizophagus irregularis TaxID=588596 RepID=A0A2I1GR47_9GLOM|nr:hypothetical protein RhiirA4_464785 [Rhizophagus irregularis]
MSIIHVNFKRLGRFTSCKVIYSPIKIPYYSSGLSCFNCGAECEEEIIIKSIFHIKGRK